MCHLSTQVCEPLPWTHLHSLHLTHTHTHAHSLMDSRQCRPLLYTPNKQNGLIKSTKTAALLETPGSQTQRAKLYLTGLPPPPPHLPTYCSRLQIHTFDFVEVFSTTKDLFDQNTPIVETVQVWQQKCFSQLAILVLEPPPIPALQAPPKEKPNSFWLASGSLLALAWGKMETVSRPQRLVIRKNSAEEIICLWTGLTDKQNSKRPVSASESVSVSFSHMLCVGLHACNENTC